MIKKKRRVSQRRKDPQKLSAGSSDLWKFGSSWQKKKRRFHREEKIPKIKRWKFGLLEIWKMKNAMKGDKKPPIRLCKQEVRENQKEKQNGVLLTYFCG